ncbi:MAG TPA: FAD-dependent oxidoreductase, partial [Bacteroidales bacterium]|nr:FAD-dependent oxidoreductase [Bacteroidales bacterium]
MKFDYDLIVIGGGAAGLTAAGIGANFGAKTMLIESKKLGGDCTWFGCVPSKTLLHVSKMVRTIKEAGKFGHRSIGEIDFASVMKHVRDTRQGVYEEADEPNIYRRMGIEVVFGRSTFTDPHKVRIEGTDSSKEVSSRYFIIATGSKPALPAIQGLSNVLYHTNETIFELTNQPRSMAIIG